MVSVFLNDTIHIKAGDVNFCIMRNACDHTLFYFFLINALYKDIKKQQHCLVLLAIYHRASEI
jgi:hypothetical protein